MPRVLTCLMNMRKSTYLSMLLFISLQIGPCTFHYLPANIYIYIYTFKKNKTRSHCDSKCISTLLWVLLWINNTKFNYIPWIWSSPVKFGVIDSYQYPKQDGNKFIILKGPVVAFLSIRFFGLLSSSLLLFPQHFGRYILWPSSGVCREPSRNFELRPLLKPRGSPVLIPLAITGYKR